MLLVLLEILARLFFHDERRAREGGRTVPGQRRTRRTRRRHRQGIEVTVEEVPVAAIVVVIAGTEFDIVQTERIPLIRRRHLVCKKRNSVDKISNREFQASRLRRVAHDDNSITPT